MSFTTNSAGGEYKHKLTVDEMPKHKHAVYIQNTTSNPQVNAPQWTVALPNSWKQYASDTKLFGPSTGNAGGVHLTITFNRTLQYIFGKGRLNLCGPSPKENNYIWL